MAVVVVMAQDVLAVVGVVRVLPDDGAAHADADAHRGQAVAHLGVLLELAGELGHQAHAGGGERVADGDRAAVRVDPRVVVGDAEVVEEGEHLHGERLVELEQADVVDREAGLGAAPSRSAGTGPTPMTSGSTPTKAKPTRRIRTGSPSSAAACSDARRHAVAPSLRPAALPAVTLPCGAERGLQGGELLERGARARRLVGGRQAPALLGVAGGDRHEVGLDLAVRVGLGELVLAAAPRTRRQRCLGEVREAVVQVLGGLAHDERDWVDEPLGDDARVRVDALAHRVAAHVLDAAGDRDVVCAERDASWRRW